ncbi:HNH endonuclease [Methanosarcina sp. KYL-1]|uniref:HNH endonuclease n=1 Tax=Methanosarcina sp. KYL-1 TaxID=2602068 RepID=UPI002100CE1E|nr:HNH endonuclease [Methanosarcina sp. KYL-1]MCQ1537303.1 HNH endonuclease [Methanosarcina sp. KYL-1]
MEQRYLKYSDGRYEADIDITVEEWKSMLQNPKIFDKASLDMVSKWYDEIDHRATTQAIMAKYPSNLKKSPYNGIVKGLTQRILKHLDRFEVIGTTGKKSVFIVPFEGWYEDYKEGNHFVWKLRDELVQALEELEMVDKQEFPSEKQELTSYLVENRPDGKIRVCYTTQYERNSINRRNAITIHGTVCQACGFDFEKTYGEIGKGYIEVHHIKPLSEEKCDVEINPETDLICVCANCHRIIHKRKDKVLSLKEVQNLLLENKK